MGWQLSYQAICSQPAYQQVSLDAFAHAGLFGVDRAGHPTQQQCLKQVHSTAHNVVVLCARGEVQRLQLFWSTQETEHNQMQQAHAHKQGAMPSSSNSCSALGNALKGSSPVCVWTIMRPTGA